jgi:hypothetical protein
MLQKQNGAVSNQLTDHGRVESVDSVLGGDDSESVDVLRRCTLFRIHPTAYGIKLSLPMPPPKIRKSYTT